MLDVHVPTAPRGVRFNGNAFAVATPDGKIDALVYEIRPPGGNAGATPALPGLTDEEIKIVEGSGS